MRSTVTGSSPAQTTRGACSAVAHSNIALAKYWGKRDRASNIPDVPSLSLTLAALSTRTRVSFDPGLDSDQLVLNGKSVTGEAAAKVFRLVERARSTVGVTTRARVESSNDFPTASGLASSASGFAALAVATLGALGLSWSPAATSELARASSVSAARSIFGGFVELPAGATAAEPIVAPSASKLRMVIAITESAPKAVGSTSGMLHTQDTSPYYPAWQVAAPRVYGELRTALLEGQLQKVGEAMEHSALLMHASMFGARPALIYWNAATLTVMQVVRELRASGVFAYFTMDAGPHVKVLTEQDQCLEVRDALRTVAGVREVIVSEAGEAAHVVEVA